MPGAVDVQDLRRTYGSVVAVDGASWSADAGTVTAVLGPNGAGKTTTVECLEGLVRPTSGAVEVLGTAPWGATAEHRARVGVMLQDGGLATTVRPLPLLRHLASLHAHPRDVDALADRLGIGAFARTTVRRMSGGQRQRVALARALVNQPQVLLLDEPLGALDLKLREEMQVELKAIQRDVGITFLFVTHDQEEALTLSDRIAVFDAGRIEQVGTAREVYEQPSSGFVAGFVGTSNLLSGSTARDVLGREGSYGIRPEKIHLAAPGGPAEGDTVRTTGTIAEVVYAGPVTRYVVDLAAGGRLVVLEQNGHRTAPDGAVRGATVELQWAPRHVIEIPA